MKTSTQTETTLAPPPTQRNQVFLKEPGLPGEMLDSRSGISPITREQESYPSLMGSCQKDTGSIVKMAPQAMKDGMSIRKHTDCTGGNTGHTQIHELITLKREIQNNHRKRRKATEQKTLSSPMQVTTPPILALKTNN